MAKSLTSDSMFSEVCRRDGAPSRLASWVWMYRAARAVHAKRTLTELARRGLLFLRQAGHRRELLRWHQAPAVPLHDMLARRPALVSVVRRPYINSAWDGARRLAAVENHYRLLTGVGSGLRTAPEAVLTLADVSGRGARVDIVLDAPAWFIHEGELCLNLFHEGERIYSLAFSLGFDAGEPVAFVGALQGMGTDRALNVYRELTTDFHGLRPRDLLVAAFRIVCRELGLARWLAVGDACRVSSSAYFRAAGAVRSSYDAVWREHGGQPRADGFQELPVHRTRRAHDEIPARKRASYRQRYELLDRLDADLSQAIRRRGRP